MRLAVRSNLHAAPRSSWPPQPLQALILARRKRLAEKAEHWCTEVHLKRNVFRGWFRVAMREHRVTVNNRYIQEVEKAKRLIHEHYQGQIADLQ